VSGRNAQDFYPTPPQAAGALVRWWRWEVRQAPRAVLDPCAGVGCLLLPWAESGSEIVGWEEDHRIAAGAISGVAAGDGLAILDRAAEAGSKAAARSILGEGVDLIAVNPPYKRADRWVKSATSAAVAAGISVAAFMRCQWIDDGETLGRSVYRHSLVPSAIVRMPWRMSFNGGGADFATYAWHVWDGGRAQDPDDRPFGGGCLTYWARPALSSPEAEDLWSRGAALSRGEDLWQCRIPGT